MSFYELLKPERKYWKQENQAQIALVAPARSELRKRSRKGFNREQSLDRRVCT